LHNALLKRLHDPQYCSMLLEGCAQVCYLARYDNDTANNAAINCLQLHNNTGSVPDNNTQEHTHANSYFWINWPFNF